MSEVPADVAAHRAWLLSFIPVRAGSAIVDLGCGTGDDLVALAAQHPDMSVQFTGVDVSDKSIAAASERARQDERITFQQHRLDGALPFSNSSVDVVYSNNLLECLASRDGFAREVARILRPGGLAVIAHWDWDSQMFDGTDKARVRRLIHAFADWQQAWMEHSDGWMGRRLWGSFAPTDLFAGTAHARVLTNTVYSPPWFGHARAQDLRALVKRQLASAEDYEAFVADQVALSGEGRYFYSITGYAFVGTTAAEPPRGV